MIRKFQQTFLVSIFVFMNFSGCRVTVEDIERWKGTQKGPDKLTAVLLDEKYDVHLRALAAWALAEINRWDRFDKAFKVMNSDSRRKIAGELVPILSTAIIEGNQPPSPPTKLQVAAKDALFVIYPFTEGKVKDDAARSLTKWCTDDFNNRFFAGRYSIEVILTKLGEKAADKLADILKPGFIAYDKVSQILYKIGSRETKEKAGRNLVEIAKTRKGRIEEPLLISIGRMGGKEARKFLLEIGESLKVPPRVQRGAIMSYLEFKLCDKEDAEQLFKIAEDVNQDYMVRNFAYDAIVCIGEKSYVPRLYKLLHEKGIDKDKFRGVGVDEILKLGGPEAIPGIVEEIINEKDPWESFEDFRDFVMVRFTQDDKGKPVKGEVRDEVLKQIRGLLELKISKKNPVARGIAVFTLGLMGESSDVELLKKYTSDGGKLRDWKAKAGEVVGEGGKIIRIEEMDFKTVGDVARWAISKIEKG